MKTKLFLIAVAAVCATGCGASFYATTNQNQNQTSVILAENNFRIVKTVSAEVNCSYVFGIGGLSRKAMMSNAISELTDKAQLTGSQALINITTKIHNKFILVWARRSMIAQGTVIEFIDKNTSDVIMSEDNKVNHRNLTPFDDKSEFEAKQMARNLCLEIMNDIRTSNLDTAIEKFLVLEQWFEQQPKKDKFIEKQINQIKSNL